MLLVVALSMTSMAVERVLGTDTSFRHSWSRHVAHQVIGSRTLVSRHYTRPTTSLCCRAWHGIEIAPTRAGAVATARVSSGRIVFFVGCSSQATILRRKARIRWLLLVVVVLVVVMIGPLSTHCHCTPSNWIVVVNHARQQSIRHEPGTILNRFFIVTPFIRLLFPELLFASLSLTP